jgi:hypothetical protein
LVQELEPRNQPAGLGLSVALLHAEGHAEAAALSLNVSDMVSIAPFHAVSVAGHGSLNSASTPFSAAFNSGFSEFLSALEQFEARSIEVFNASINVVTIPFAEVITISTPAPAARPDVPAQSSSDEMSAAKTSSPATDATGASQSASSSAISADSSSKSDRTKATPQGKSPSSAHSAVPTATVGTAVRGTGNSIAGVGGGTTPFVIVNGSAVLAGSGPSGGGALAAPAAANLLPSGAALQPGAITNTGTVTGGSPEALPAVEQPPAVEADTGGANESSAAPAIGEEAPAIGTRLESLLAALAAAAYGVWHWRRRNVTAATRAGLNFAARRPAGIRLV